MNQNQCIVFVNEIPTKLPDYTRLDTQLHEGASGNGVINLHTFTKTTFMKKKTAIITEQEYKELTYMYQTKPYFNLVMFDIYNTNNYLGKDKNKLCCMILFINDVYSYHYICTIDTIEDKTQHIKNIITKGNMNIKKCSLIKITFNEDGSFNDFMDEPLF